MIVKCNKLGRWACPGRPDVPQVSGRKGEVMDVDDRIGEYMIELGDAELGSADAEEPEPSAAIEDDGAEPDPAPKKSFGKKGK